MFTDIRYRKIEDVTKYKFSIKIPAKIIFIDKAKGIEVEDDIYLEHISYVDITVVLSNNELLTYLFEKSNKDSIEIRIEFSYNDEEYNFFCKIKKFRIYDIAERNLYTSVIMGFDIEHFSNFRLSLIELLITLDMEDIYLG